MRALKENLDPNGTLSRAASSAASDRARSGRTRLDYAVRISIMAPIDDRDPGGGGLRIPRRRGHARSSRPPGARVCAGGLARRICREASREVCCGRARDAPPVSPRLPARQLHRCDRRSSPPVPRRRPGHVGLDAPGLLAIDAQAKLTEAPAAAAKPADAKSAAADAKPAAAPSPPLVARPPPPRRARHPGPGHHLEVAERVRQHRRLPPDGRRPDPEDRRDVQRPLKIELLPNGVVVPFGQIIDAAHQACSTAASASRPTGSARTRRSASGAPPVVRHGRRHDDRLGPVRRRRRHVPGAGPGGPEARRRLVLRAADADPAARLVQERDQVAGRSEGLEVPDGRPQRTCSRSLASL